MKRITPIFITVALALAIYAADLRGWFTAPKDAVFSISFRATVIVRDITEFLTGPITWLRARRADARTQTELLRLERLSRALETQNREYAARIAMLERELAASPNGERTRLIIADAVYLPEVRAPFRLVINRGSRHGIEQGFTVTTPENAFIGIITDLRPYSATVDIFIRRDAVTGAYTRAGRIKGAVTGLGGEAEFVAPTASGALKEGDVVLTAGTTQGAARGIPIGVIHGLKIDAAIGRTSARIMPLATLDHVEMVKVLLP